MILEVVILTIALGLASTLNFFIIPAIAGSIVEKNDEEEEIKPFPYTTMIVINALTWLILTICFSFLGFLVWKVVFNPRSESGFLLPIRYFLSNAFQGHHMIYPMFLGIATVAFIITGSLIAEKSADIPINLDTSLKFSLVMPHHKSKKENGQKTAKEVKVFQLINLIMMVSTSIPAVLAVSS